MRAGAEASEGDGRVAEGVGCDGKREAGVEVVDLAALAVVGRRARRRGGVRVRRVEQLGERELEDGARRKRELVEADDAEYKLTYLKVRACLLIGLVRSI